MMTIEEALVFADKCENDGNISTSAKALIVLAHRVRELEDEQRDRYLDAKFEDRD